MKIAQLMEKTAELEKQKQDLLLDQSLSQVTLAQTEKKAQSLQEELGKTKQLFEQKQSLMEKIQARKRNVADAATETDPLIISVPASPSTLAQAHDHPHLSLHQRHNEEGEQDSKTPPPTMSNNQHESSPKTILQPPKNLLQSQRT